MKTIAEIDKNFAASKIDRSDIKWCSALDEPFGIYGLCAPRETGRFERMPKQLQQDESINEGCRTLMSNTSGGRIRFITDSPFVAIRVELPRAVPMAHMPSTGHSGFDLYVGSEKSSDMRFCKTFFPPNTNCEYYDGIVYLDDVAPSLTSYEVMLNFPLYNGVNTLFIGIKDTAALRAPTPYAVKKPVVFYGTSITQGGCASRPGNNFTHHLSRWIDCDFINLGFSGSARGEKHVAEYIATLDMSAFFLDFEANCFNTDMLRDRYYPFYETVRKAWPNLPIIMASMPSDYRLRERKAAANHSDMNVVVMESYLKAYPEDKNLFYIDGASMFGGCDPDASTVDGAHPNDLGFYRMAETIYPILKKAIFR